MERNQRWFSARRLKLPHALLLVLLFVMAACGGAGEGQSTGTPGAAGGAVQTPSVAASKPTATVIPPTPTLGPDMFQNPVLKADFPDPHILPVGDRYYAYATNASGRNIQMAMSDDLITWELLNDAMPVLPGWAAVRTGFVWAPEVIQIGEKFVLYYTARDKIADRQCIGVATADQPEGKFRDTNDAAFICQPDLGGSIDPHPFQTSDGKLYMYWKNDGNCCGRPTKIYVQEMAPDGLSLMGEPVELVKNDKVWEGAVVEAPTMWEREGRFYLFYSGNDYGGVNYSIGVAYCETPTGPCQDDPDNPLVESYLKNPPVIGPGHQTVIRVDDQDWLVYHAWEVTTQGVKTNRRFVWMDRLEWQDGEPVLRGPTTGPQEKPEEE